MLPILSARCRPIVALAAACCARPALAAAPAADAARESSFVGELLAIVVPLALIIVALFLVLRLARRRYGLTGQDAPLSILQILPVGPRERIVLVRARSGRVFTIGVGPQSVNFITDLNPDDLQSSETSTETSDIHTASGR
jgi:flagellar biogenesis protein FliO